MMNHPDLARTRRRTQGALRAVAAKAKVMADLGLRPRWWPSIRTPSQRTAANRRLDRRHHRLGPARKGRRVPLSRRGPPRHRDDVNHGMLAYSWMSLPRRSTRPTPGGSTAASPPAAQRVGPPSRGWPTASSWTCASGASPRSLPTGHLVAAPGRRHRVVGDQLMITGPGSVPARSSRRPACSRFRFWDLVPA